MTVEERLARLERDNRWMRRACALGLAVTAAVVLTGQAKDETTAPRLRAREIQVVDAVGRVRIVLEGDSKPKEADAAEIRMLAPDGSAAIRLRSAKSVVLFSACAAGKGSAGADVLVLGSGEESEAVVQVASDKTFLKAGLKASAKEASLFVLDPRHDPLDGYSTFGVRDDGSRGLWLLDSRGKRRGSLALAPDGSPSLDFADKQGATIYQLPPPELKPGR